MLNVGASRLIAFAVSLSGPAIVLFADADRGLWVNRVLSFEFAFPVAFASCLALALGLGTPAYGIPRLLLLAIGGPAVLLATWALAFPIMFGLGEIFRCEGVCGLVTLTLLAVPAASFQVWSNPAPGHRVWLFIAFLIAPGGAVALAYAASSIPLNGTLPEIPEKMWEPWATLLALLPAAALSIKVARPVPFPRAVALLLLAALPWYMAKAALDGRDKGVLEAALWPVRVWSEFIGRSDYLRLWQEANRLRPGEPIRIGEHWYRFTHVGFWQPFTESVRRPDRVYGAHVDIPVEDLDLSEIHIANSRLVRLTIRVRVKADAEDQRDGPDIFTADEDLIIVIVAPRGERKVDRDAVREKLRRFIRAARTSPPTMTR